MIIFLNEVLVKREIILTDTIIDIIEKEIKK